jgi:hypothetical protein
MLRQSPEFLLPNCSQRQGVSDDNAGNLLDFAFVAGRIKQIPVVIKECYRFGRNPNCRQ